MLALVLMVGLALPASAAPSTVVGTGDSVTVTDSVGSVDAPSHHFGFSQASVLGQATSQGVSFGTGATASPNTGVTVGSNVTKTIPVNNISGGTLNGVQLVDTLPAGTTFVSASSTVGTCTGPTVGTTGTVTCTIGTLTAAQNATVTIVLTATATAPTTVVDPVTVNGTLSTGTGFTNSTNILFTMVSGPNQSPTGATALAALQQGGFTANGVQSCVGLTNPINPINPITPFNGINGTATGIGIGSTCPITGQLTGSATITGSATWNVTVAAAPAGALVGVAPVAFALTTTNSVAPGEGPFACPALAAAGAAVTCNFTTVGNPLIGTTVAVCFTTPGVGVGGVTCVFGQVGPATNVRPPVILPNLPVLPPPPLEFIPPPPPPLLPPPPPAPTGAAAAPVRGAFPEVPVIPEADSLFLVIGGLVALGGLVGYRRLRRRPDDDIA